MVAIARLLIKKFIEIYLAFPLVSSKMELFLSIEIKFICKKFDWPWIGEKKISM